MSIKERLEKQILNSNGIIEPLAIRNTMPGVPQKAATAADHAILGSINEETTSIAPLKNGDGEEELYRDHGTEDVRKITSNMSDDLKSAILAMAPSTNDYEVKGYRYHGMGFYFYRSDYGVDSLAFGDMTKRAIPEYPNVLDRIYLNVAPIVITSEGTVVNPTTGVASLAVSPIAITATGEYLGPVAGTGTVAVAPLALTAEGTGIYETSVYLVLQAGSSVQYGAAQVLQATITGLYGAPTPVGYNVDFYVDSVYVGSSNTNGSGIATYDIGTSRNVGTYSIGAILTASGHYVQSGGTGINTYTITQATVTASLTSSNNPSDFGGSWALQATFTSSTGATINTGTAEFFDNDLTSAVYSTESVSSNAASSIVPGDITGGATLPLATTWKVKYNGSTNFAASAYSSNHSHTTEKQETWTYAGATSPASGYEGDPITVNGNVWFAANNRSILVDVYIRPAGGGSATLIVDNGATDSDGVFAIAATIPVLPAGNYVIEAYCLGDNQSEAADHANFDFYNYLVIL